MYLDDIVVQGSPKRATLRYVPQPLRGNQALIGVAMARGKSPIKKPSTDPHASPTSGKRQRETLAAKRKAKRNVSVVKQRAAALARGEIIIADLSKQAPNNSYGPPAEYRDQPFTCVDCGKEEVWTARQQQWWYEVAKGTIYSHAVRCRACRRKHREAKRNAQLPKRRAP